MLGTGNEESHASGPNAFSQGQPFFLVFLLMPVTLVTRNHGQGVPSDPRRQNLEKFLETELLRILILVGNGPRRMRNN